MPFKQFIPTFLLIMVATLSGWLVIKSLEAPLNTPLLPREPDAYMYNVRAVRMNALEGTPQDQLFTPLMVHYPLGDTTAVVTPHVVVFNSNGAPWHIYALHGQAQAGVSTIQLWDHVRLEQAASAQNQAMTITTTAMTIFPQQQYAETQQPVQLWQQPGGTASSVGLRAYLKTGIIELLSQAHGQYQSAAPKK